jgi:menaquinone-dependent protoporphyrinogen oxidase
VDESLAMEITMSSILILYGTTEGQTSKIASFLAARLRALGSEVQVLNALDARDDLDLSRLDAVILAASLHTGRYQAAVEHFAKTHHEQLNAMLSAFVSVSLSTAGDDEDDVQGLAHCVEDLQRTTGWQPRFVHHAAGAFRYTQYDFFKRWALKYIAWRKGGPTDTSQDWELTDWEALSSFADSLVTQMKPGSVHTE